MLKTILITVALCFAMTSVSADHAVPIKNPEVQLKSISRDDVYWIYTLKTRFWNDGSRIVVYYMNFSHPIHVSFVRDVLEVSPVTFQTSVETYVNTGNAAYFRKVSTEDEMVNRVSLTDGSVGYLSSTVFLMNDGKHGVKKINITR